MVYFGQSIKNVRLAITGSPLAAELIDLGDWIDAVMCSYKLGTEILLSELRHRLLPLKERREAIVETLNQKTGRNDTCPCQPGLKYKRCCGQSWWAAGAERVLWFPDCHQFATGGQWVVKYH